MKTTTQEGLAEATFACGCFWDAQDAFDNTPGVVETVAGYSGGDTPNPNQQEVAQGGTGYVETVLVKYDPGKISYRQLLKVYWSTLSGITLRALEFKSGQYKPVIFANSEDQFIDACQSVIHARTSNKRPISAASVVVAKAQRFWPEPAQEHQHYYRKNEKPKWM